ncbi:hypothetical protein HY251_08970 [bacterium]|nr:hypothetical protein [bacterium]
MRSLAPELAAAALAALVYAATFHGSFLSYDDPNFITGVEAVRSPSLRGAVRLFLPWEPVWGSYHPLHILSYVLDSCLFGMEERGAHRFHLQNIFYYSICAALVVRVARRFGVSEWGALAAGLIFAVHPSHAESAAWLTGRKDVLSGALVLGALLCATRPERTGSDLASAFGLFVLALMAKTTAVVLAPFLVLEALLFGKLDRREALLVAPFVALAGFWLALELEAQHSVQAVKTLRGGTIWGQLRLVEWGLPWYPVRFLWPHPLTPRPDLPVTDGFSLGDAQALAILAVALAVFLVSASRRKRAALAIGWFFLALLPVANFVPMASPVQDRYLFLPSIAACCVVGDVLARVFLDRGGLRAAIGALLLGGVVGIAAGETVRYARIWRSDVDLWEETLKVDPRSAIAHWGLAAALTDKGDQARAAREAELSVENGGGTEVQRLQGMIAEKRGLRAEAFSAYRRSWSANDASLLAGVACVRLSLEDGDIEGAAVFAAQLKERKPDTPEALLAEARVAHARGQLGDAEIAFKAALALRGGERTLAWLELAAVERALSRYDEAEDALANAEREGAKTHDLHQERASLALARGQDVEALKQATAALKLEPEDRHAKKTLALALAALGRLDEAAEVLSALLEARGEADVAWDLARVEARAGRDDRASTALARAVALDRGLRAKAREDPLLSRLALGDK